MYTSVFSRAFAVSITLAAAAGCGGSTSGTGGSTGGTGGSTGDTGGSGGGGSTSSTTTASGTTSGTGGSSPQGSLRVINGAVGYTAPVDVFLEENGVLEMPAFATGMQPYEVTPNIVHASGGFSLAVHDANAVSIPFGSFGGVAIGEGIKATAWVWAGAGQQGVVTNTDDSLAGLAAGKARAHFGNFDPGTVKVLFWDGPASAVPFTGHDVYRMDVSAGWKIQIDKNGDNNYGPTVFDTDLPAPLPVDEVTDLVLGSDDTGIFLKVVTVDGAQTMVYAH